VRPLDDAEVSLCEAAAVCAALAHGVAARAAWPTVGAPGAEVAIVVLVAGALLAGAAVAGVAALVLELAPRGARGSALAGAAAAAVVVMCGVCVMAGGVGSGPGLGLGDAVVVWALLCGVRVARGAGRWWGLGLALLVGAALVVGDGMRVGIAAPGLVVLLGRRRERWLQAAPLALLGGALGAWIGLGHVSPQLVRDAGLGTGAFAQLPAAAEHQLGLLVIALAGCGLLMLLRARALAPAGLLCAAAAATVGLRPGPSALLPAVAVLAGVAIAQLPRRLGMAAPAASAALAGIIAVQPIWLAAAAI